MLLISYICYAQSWFFPLPRQFLKVSANVIQFKAFNVSSMGHTTFSMFVLASSLRQGRNVMSTFHQKLIFMTNCNCILFHYLQTIYRKHCTHSLSQTHTHKESVCQPFYWPGKLFALLFALQTVFLIQLQLFAKCCCNCSLTVCKLFSEQ